MKKSFLFLVITLLTLTSCTKQDGSLKNDQPFAENSTQLSTSALGAQPYNVQDDISLDGRILQNPCTESIELAGIVHIFWHGVYDPKTNTSKDLLHINMQGVKGVGLTTGNEYQVHDNVSERKMIGQDGCILTFSAAETYRATTAHANNNLYFVFKLTYTYDLCTSEYTVKRDELSLECR